MIRNAKVGRLISIPFFFCLVHSTWVSCVTFSHGMLNDKSPSYRFFMKRTILMLPLKNGNPVHHRRVLLCKFSNQKPVSSK